MRHRTGMCVLMMILGLSLSACGGAEGGNRAEQLALDIRGEYLEMGGCTASLELTADYGQRVYTYGIGLNYASEGETTLTITAPENIAGVTARILEGETALEYDGMRVETGPLDDSGMSPVDAVPVLMDYVQEGFIAECGMEAQGESEVLRVVCREPESAAHPRPSAGGAVSGRLYRDPVCLYGVSVHGWREHIANGQAGQHPAWPFAS